MSKTYTDKYNLEKDDANEFYDVMVQSRNMDKTEAALVDLSKAFTAGGTGTAITIAIPSLSAYRDGLKLTVVASANNAGAATTIKANALSAVPLYKPGTTTAPNLTTGKAYEVWYNLAGNCFFLKASAEGDAVAANVLAGKTFSNDADTGLAGTMPNNVGFNPATAVDGVTTAGRIYMKPAIGYYDGNDDLIYSDDPDFVAGNFLATKNVFGLQGDIPVKTGQYGAVAASIGGGYINVDMPGAGYYPDDALLTIYDADFITANVKKDVNMWGLVGTYDPTQFSPGALVFARNYKNFAYNSPGVANDGIFHKMQEIKITGGSGSLTARYQANCVNVASLMKIAIFVNGVQRTTEQVMLAGTNVYTVTVSGLVKNDLVQLYYSATGYGNSVNYLELLVDNIAMGALPTNEV